MKRATAQNVAIEAGVSKWTVIRAFTPGSSITETSKAKVLAAAEKLDYRPNLLAQLGNQPDPSGRGPGR
jgi:LacI family transcriptional regulator